MNFRTLFRSRIAIFAGALLLTLTAYGLCLAQSGTSSVRGTVTDPQNQVIAGASVTLKSTTKNFSRTQVTAGDGGYVFAAVPPDTYTVEVEASGFKKAVTRAFEALVDTPKTVDVPLEIGQFSETVTVASGAEAELNTTDATLGNTFNNRQVITLPLNARNTPDLLSLQPGVTPDNGTGNGGAVNGGRQDQANVTLDGVDVNEQQGGRAFFSVLRVTPESLQEFRVTTTNANADQGRSSGAQVSLITRGGSNEWHGSAYLYYRPKTAFQANNFFNNKAGVAQPSLERRNYGGSVLGPVIKNKLFFSFFYERFVENTSTPVVRTVPLPTLGQGIVRYRSANGASDPTCPAGTPAGVTCLTPAQINAGYTAANGSTPGINPAALAALAAAANRYKANDTTVGDGLNTGGFRFNAPQVKRYNNYTTRLDAKFWKGQDVFVRYQYQFDNESSIQRFPDTPSPKNWIHPQGVSAGHIWTINNNAVNRFTYGLTREAFTIGGDSSQNFISFRFIFQPYNFSRTLNRVTPVHNFVDDFTYVLGNHTISTGGNIRLISNRRTTFGSSYDNASTNPSFYNASGAVLYQDANGNNIFPNLAGSSAIDLRNALAAVIGRFSQYGASLQYGKSGNLQPVGSGVNRNFKTQEYEFYAQDSWRLFSNLTVNYGLRWSTSTPVYEANGLQVKPLTSLSGFFDRRVQAAFNGQADNELIKVDIAGKANGRSGYYKQDWNNFAPAISAAWSPNFKNKYLKAILGGDNKSTIRGGFRMTYDRIGSALAVAFDLNSTLGYSASSSVSANTFDVVTGTLGPLFTGFGQDFRTPQFFGPGAALPALQTNIQFPLQSTPDNSARIEQSLDDKLQTPYNYNFNLSYGREIAKGITVEVSYVGRFAHKLLVSRDVAHFNNLRDPVSGQDFYTVMRQLISYREANAPISSIPNIPWFNRFVPALAGNYSVCGSVTALTATQAAYRRIARSTVNNVQGGQCIGGRNTTDYTFVQQGFWNLTPSNPYCSTVAVACQAAFDNMFVHPQYATFAAYSTIGESSYNALQVSVRKRFQQGLQFDFNYTYGHSLDTASGTESSGTISSGASLILNPLVLRTNYGNSDFDVRHLINANFIYELPLGKGKPLFGNVGRFTNAIIGGWTLTGIYRWNTGFPIGQPFDDGRWATNWNVQSNGIQIRDIQIATSKNGKNGEPNLFADPNAAYASFRNAYPGEPGDRNILREANFVTFDAGLQKNFQIRESNRLNFRMEVFNVTNTQRLTGVANFRLGQDPYLSPNSVPSDFGRLTAIQGNPRIVQFVARYEF
jgi:hypothetical protein